MPKYFDLANYPKRASNQVTIFGSILTLTGTSGTANITINGVLNTVIATFASTLTATAAAWVVANYEFYKLKGFLVSSAAALITVVPANSWDTVNRVNASVSAAVSGNLSGTNTGVFEPDLTKAKTWQVIFGRAIAVKKPKGLIEGDRIRLELKATGAYATTFDIDGFLFPGGTENAQTSTSIDTVTGTVNISMFPREDRVTITGTVGTATIVAGGVSAVATFDTNLTTTASNFVTANAAAYLAVGLILTSAAAVLTFKSDATRIVENYVTATIVNTTTDLDGTVVKALAGRILVDAAVKDIKQ